MKRAIKQILTALGLHGPARRVLGRMIRLKRALLTRKPAAQEAAPVDTLTPQIDAAFALINQGALDEAERTITALRRQHPGNPVLAWGQGLILRRQGAYEQAIEVLSGWEDARLQAECRAAEDDLAQQRAAQCRDEITALCTQGKYSAARKTLHDNAALFDAAARAQIEVQIALASDDRAALDSLLEAQLQERPQNRDIVIMALARAQASDDPDYVTQMLERVDFDAAKDPRIPATRYDLWIKLKQTAAICKDLPRREADHPGCALWLLYQGVCAALHGAPDEAAQQVAGFINAVDPEQAYLWSDHIRIVGGHFLNAGMAAECAALLDLLHRCPQFQGTPAGRYNHGYSMTAHARLDNPDKVVAHGLQRLDPLERDPGTLLEDLFGPDAAALDPDLSAAQSAQQIADLPQTAQLEVPQITARTDVILTKIPAMLSFQRTYSINPLCDAQAAPVRRLGADLQTVYRQCDIALQVARLHDATSSAVLRRLLTLYVYQGRLDAAAGIRAALDALGELPAQHPDLLRYDVRRPQDGGTPAGMRRAELVGFADWLAQAGAEMGADAAQVICPEAEKTVQFPFFETVQPRQISYTFKTPELRIGEVRDVVCTGRGTAVNAKGQAIRDDFLFPHCAALPPGTLAASDNRALLKTGQPLWQAPEDCLSLLDMPVFRNEFYHTVAQYLSRLALLERRGLIADRPVLVPSTLGRGAYAVLDAMGFDRARLISAPAGHDVALGRALMPSPGYEMRAPQPDEMDALRAMILARHGAAGPQDEKIYISRRAFNNRILTNEPELEAIAARLGYRVIQPETLPLPEQAALFSRASVIVGATGAGLVNMVHAPPGAKVICMTIADHAIDFWPVMADALGHEFAFMAGQPFFPGAPVQVQTFDFRVDTAVFEAALTQG